MNDDLINRLREAADGVDESLRPLLEEAAYEIDRMHEAVDSMGEDGDEVVWRDRDGTVEFLSSREWVIKASNELVRLRGVIDTYVGVCEAGSHEISQMRHKNDALAAEVVHLRHRMGVTEPMPEIPKSEET